MPNVPAAARPGSWRTDLACLGLLLGSGLWLFWPSFGNGFYDDDFVLLERCTQETLGSVVREDLFGYRTMFWRPVWYLLWQAAHAVFGTAAAGYLALGIGLHLGLASALYVALRRWTAPAAALAGAASYLLCPGLLEGVLWPAAALNVLPAALLLLVAGLAIERAATTASRGAYALALGAGAISLGCREAAYQLPLVWLAGAATRWPAARPGRWRWLGAVPFALLVLLHQLFLNRTSGTGFTLAEHLRLLAELSGHYAADLLALPWRGLKAWWLAGPLLLLAFATGSPRARYCLLWTAAATFPYVLKAHGSRFVLLAAVPAALWLGTWLHDAPAARRRWLWPLVLLLLGLHLSGHRAAQAVYRAHGDGARALLASAQQLRLAEAPLLAVDRLPVELRNGLEPALRLQAGRGPAVREMLLLPRPPLLVHIGFAPESLPEDAVFVHYHEAPDPAARRFEIVPRQALGQGLVPMFVVSVAPAVEVVGDAAAAVQRIQSGEVDPRRTTLLVGAPELVLPSPPQATIDAVRIDGVLLEVQVTAATPFLLNLCHVVDLTTVNARAEADGGPLRLRQANGVANAVEVPAGTRTVRVKLLPP